VTKNLENFWELNVALIVCSRQHRPPLMLTNENELNLPVSL
jgi:hypothetical protein